VKRVWMALAGAFVLAAMGALGFVLTAPPATADSGKPEAEAHVMALDHKIIGEALFTHVAGGVKVHLSVHGLKPGMHAVHIHSVANCSDGFTPAGGHWDVGHHAHGKLVAGGPHSGDLDNVTVAVDGTLKADLFLRDATIQPGPMSLMDEDGSSIVIHAGPDDYKTQPAGNAGDRVACGTIGFIPINVEPTERPD